MTEPRRFTREQLPSSDSLHAVVKELGEFPGIPTEIETPKGLKRPGKTLSEWREVLETDGGIRDPFGNTHAFDLSPWDHADPNTVLVVAVTNAPS